MTRLNSMKWHDEVISWWKLLQWNSSLHLLNSSQFLTTFQASLHPGRSMARNTTWKQSHSTPTTYTKLNPPCHGTGSNRASLIPKWSTCWLARSPCSLEPLCKPPLKPSFQPCMSLLKPCSCTQNAWPKHRTNSTKSSAQTAFLSRCCCWPFRSFAWLPVLDVFFSLSELSEKGYKGHTAFIPSSSSFSFSHAWFSCW